VLEVGNGSLPVLLNSLARPRMGWRHRGEPGVHNRLEMPVKRGIPGALEDRVFTYCSQAWQPIRRLDPGRFGMCGLDLRPRRAARRLRAGNSALPIALGEARTR